MCPYLVRQLVSYQGNLCVLLILRQIAENSPCINTANKIDKKAREKSIKHQKKKKIRIKRIKYCKSANFYLNKDLLFCRPVPDSAA